MGLSFQPVRAASRRDILILGFLTWCKISDNQQPPTTNHQPPTTNHQPTTNNQQPPTTNQHSFYFLLFKLFA
jgi:hypothetical protein